ncbi:IGFLR1 isoform 6, partial [Pan troglodytes]
NCGLNDHGDFVTPPFRECSSGQCNPDGAELCSPCGGGAVTPTPAAGGGRSPWRCREAPWRQGTHGRRPHYFHS